MSPSQVDQPYWVVALQQATDDFRGGARSFPATIDGKIKQCYAYDPPNKAYQKLFFRQATVSHSQSEPHRQSCSAGWLIPECVSDCHPVLIAHSILSAIALIRDTLPLDTLSDLSWASLVAAAQSLAQDAQDVPPSAQKPTQDAFRPPPRSGSKHLLSIAPLSPSSKRFCSPDSPHQDAQDWSNAASPSPRTPSEDGEEPEQTVLVTTVTNNNRRAETLRRKKEALQQQKKKQAHGLIGPNEKADRQEKLAYEAIEQQDEPDVAWIIKQDAGDGEDLYTSAKLPYVTATSMLTKARALGNEDAREHAATFLQNWRLRGSPFSTWGGRMLSPAPSDALGTQVVLTQRATPLSADDEAFCYVHALVQQYERRLAAMKIEYRWAMAFLGRRYASKIAELQQGDQAAGRGKHQHRDGKGKLRTEAINALLVLRYPDAQRVTKPTKAAFKACLKRANRWYDAANTLGWGSLCLMPDEVNSNWVEKVLRVGEWRIWLELAKKVNPEAHAASMALDTWLGSEGIAGKPINSKETLCIEVAAPNAPNSTLDVEEINDTDAEDEDGESTSLSQSSVAPIRQMRQRSLLELFKPQA